MKLKSDTLFKMAEMLDAMTLEVKVLKDWHATRQKLVTTVLPEIVVESASFGIQSLVFVSGRLLLLA